MNELQLLIDDPAAELGFVSYCGRPTCRRVYRPKAGRGRPQEYCTEDCRRAADAERKHLRALISGLERTLDSLRHQLAAYGDAEPVPAGQVEER